MINQHFVWQEKYRPRSVKDIILPKELRDFFNKIIEDKKIPHMTLFSTKPGSGKTSCAKALCYDLGINDFLYINASKDGVMDTLETQIIQYVTTMSMEGNDKVVILDDAECAGEKFQKSLRAFIEQYSMNCSFIITTNNLYKIDEKLLSRCPVQDFNFTNQKIRSEIAAPIALRLIDILNKEKVEFDKETIKKLVLKCYPDIRKMISRLQADAIKFGSITENVLIESHNHDKLFNFIFEKNIREARKYCIDNGCDYDELYTLMFNNLVPKIKDTDKQNVVILQLAKYMDMSARSLDKEITFTAAIIDISNNV